MGLEGPPGAAAISWEGDGIGLDSSVVVNLGSAPLTLPVKGHSTWSGAWVPKDGAPVSYQQRTANTAESGRWG